MVPKVTVRPHLETLPLEPALNLLFSEMDQQDQALIRLLSEMYLVEQSMILPFFEMDQLDRTKKCPPFETHLLAQVFIIIVTDFCFDLAE